MFFLWDLGSFNSIFLLFLFPYLFEFLGIVSGGDLCRVI